MIPHRIYSRSLHNLFRPPLLITGIALVVGLSGCITIPSFFPTSGPNTSEVLRAEDVQPKIPIVDLNDTVSRRVQSAQERTAFSEVLPDESAPIFVVGPGDVLEVSVWEAPPAALFGTTVLDPLAGAATTRMTSFPEQMVEEDGTLNIPFAGEVPVAGKTLQEIEGEIVSRLTGKANQPQVLVRVTRNVTANATVVGEVVQSKTLPITAKGERLLDALATAGGVRQPVDKITIQITRKGEVLSMPLDAVIRDPKQNILLHPGDVITALHQPLSFTALGAAGRNEEINFEAKGITLAQALGRIGGLQDMRANARGVFIFRFEDPAAVEAGDGPLPMTPEGKVPVVYRADLKDPRIFLAAQNFPMHDKDVVYVANATAAELQKFLNLLTSSIFSIVNILAL
jgi:polysaccharide export outer membrane protein